MYRACGSTFSLAVALIVATGASSAATTGASPASSPYPIRDGESWIAYTWVHDFGGDGVNENGLYLVRPDGRDRHLLLDMPAGHADWSPDGERLAFDTEPEDGEQIWTVDADGTNAQVVMCAGAACGPAASPAWSPDGRYLLFNRALPREAGQEYDRVAIEVADLATGATRLVAASPVAGTEYVEYIGPRWSPDGTHIVFTVMRYPVPPTDENILGSSIATVAADGSDGDAPRVLTDPAMFGNYPDWSPDGERIVLSTYPLGSFPQTTKATNLYMIAPDGTGLTQVTRFGENDTRATQPTWTPDGQRIVFTDIERDPSDPYRRLVALIDADGSDLTLIQIPAAQVDEHGDKWFGTHARMRPSP